MWSIPSKPKSISVKLASDDDVADTWQIKLVLFFTGTIDFFYKKID